MTNNSDGLSPTLRPQLGKAFGRALPAPFGFDNGIKPDGVNDYFSITGLKSEFCQQYAIEFWMNFLTSSYSSANQGVFVIESTGPKRFGILLFANSSVKFGWLKPDTSVGAIGDILAVGNKYYVAVNYDMTNGQSTFYINGGLINGGFSAVIPTDFSSVLDFVNIYLFKYNSAYANSQLFDEFRFYNRLLTQEEISLNYNAGVGNNPSKTEGIKSWLKFEKAESDTDLYPSGIPSGWTSGAWGIRDVSGNNNHAMQMNQTNDATLGGNIQPF